MTPTGFETDSVNHCWNNRLRLSEIFSVPKSVPIFDNDGFSPDDRQALETIISLWPGLLPEMKIGVLHMIEAASKVYTGR